MDPEVVELFKRLFASELPSRDRVLQAEVNEILSTAVRHNTLNSSRTFVMKGQLAGNELLIRSNLALQTLLKVANAKGQVADEAFAAGAKDLLMTTIDQEAGKLRELQVTRTKAPGLMQSAGTSTFDPFIAQARENIAAQLDLHVASSRTQQSSSVTTGNITVNAPVGVLQVAGIGSIGRATQTIDQSVRSNIEQVLQQVARTIDSLPDGILDKEDVKLALTDAIEEARKPKPSATKLKGLLSGVSSAIQGIASAKDAYEALRGAMQFLGISI